MIKKLILATFYSIIAFCVVSYITVMSSLFQSVGDLSKKPVTNIGYPFKYYYQFWLRGNDSPNCGWEFQNFELDCFITWIVCVVIYFIIKRKQSH